MALYLIVIERVGTDYEAFSPDLPGYVARGRTREDVLKAMEEAIKVHLEGKREEGLPQLTPRSIAPYSSLEI